MNIPKTLLAHRQVPRWLSLRAAMWLAPLVAAIGSPAVAGVNDPSPTPEAARAAPLGCLIQPELAADVGVAVIGTIAEVTVDRGDVVRKGQVLATLDADVERAHLGAARSRAMNDGEIQAAKALRDNLREKLRSTSQLQQLGGASALDVQQARSEFESADGRYQQALQNRQTAQAEAATAERQLMQKTIRSPFDAVIVERHVQPGERADGKPMFRVATLSPLKVEIVAPTALYGRFKEGMPVSVTPDYPSATPVLARVARIDRLVDASSGTFRAQLRLPNPQGDIPAGLRCKVAWQDDGTR